jgi:hypothetical protein
MVFRSSRVSLLAGTALLALCAGQGFAATPHKVAHPATNRALTVLYDQTSNPSGSGTFSQDFGPGNPGTSAAADDFIVPDGQTWIIKEVDVPGTYFNGVGPATETVTFFKDKAHKVGNVVAERDNLNGADDNGSFAITLGGKGVKLRSGHYWVSVVAKMSTFGVEWTWENQAAGTTEGDPAMWENPGGDTCTTWTAESVCFGGPIGDQVFTLKGKAK